MKVKYEIHFDMVAQYYSRVTIYPPRRPIGADAPDTGVPVK
jgi:hypothetical protein